MTEQCSDEISNVSYITMHDQHIRYIIWYTVYVTYLAQNFYVFQNFVNVRYNVKTDLI